MRRPAPGCEDCHGCVCQMVQLRSSLPFIFKALLRGVMYDLILISSELSSPSLGDHQWVPPLNMMWKCSIV